MSRTIVSLSIYFGLLFVIAMLVPFDAGGSSIPTGINATNITGSQVDSSIWGIGDNLKLFASFFSFGAWNVSGMPSEVFTIFSIFNTILLVIFIYVCIIAVRGGGGV